MGLGDQIERQVKKDAHDVVVIFAKVIGLALLLAWPMVLIDGVAFAPHPNWWQYTLGVIAEMLWLSVIGLFYVAARRGRKQ